MLSAKVFDRRERTLAEAVVGLSFGEASVGGVRHPHRKRIGIVPLDRLVRQTLAGSEIELHEPVVEPRLQLQGLAEDRGGLLGSQRGAGIDGRRGRATQAGGEASNAFEAA